MSYDEADAWEEATGDAMYEQVTGEWTCHRHDQAC